MSGPPPGWQEAGAPCTGESLFLQPALGLFLFSLPSLFTYSYFLKARDIWHPQGLSSCWPGEIWSAVGDFAFSWCSPDLSARKQRKANVHACNGPSPDFTLPVEAVQINTGLNPNDVLSRTSGFLSAHASLLILHYPSLMPSQNASAMPKSSNKKL